MWKGSKIFRVGVILMLMFVLLLGVFYYLLQTGGLNLHAFKNAIGHGTAEVEVLNLADTELFLRVTPPDTSDEFISYQSLETRPTELGSIRSISPGTYTLEFTNASSEVIGTCRSHLSSGDLFVFYATNEAIIVTQKGFTPSNGRDLLLETSSLCQS